MRKRPMTESEREFYAGFKQVYPPKRTLTPGCRVQIVGDHPHAGRVGTFEEADNTLAGPAALIRFADGDGCYVFEPTHLRPTPEATDE